MTIPSSSVGSLPGHVFEEMLVMSLLRYRATLEMPSDAHISYRLGHVIGGLNTLIWPPGDLKAQLGFISQLWC